VEDKKILYHLASSDMRSVLLSHHKSAFRQFQKGEIRRRRVEETNERYCCMVHHAYTVGVTVAYPLPSRTLQLWTLRYQQTQIHMNP